MLKGLKSNSLGEIQKDYDETKLYYVPYEQIMFERDPHHYMSVEKLVNKREKQFEIGKTCLILQKDHFGLVGKIEETKDPKNQSLKINKEVESHKVRNFSFAGEIYAKNKKTEVFYDSYAIAQKIGCHVCTINRLTSSMIIKYESIGTLTRQIDIGLKIRNVKQKVHIPNEVRFYESINGKYTSQTWEYSQDVLNVLSNYIRRFPFLDVYFVWLDEQQSNTRGKEQGPKYNHLEDLLPFEKSLEKKLQLIEEVKQFVESEETNIFINHKFVPAGFQFCHPSIVTQIDKKLQKLKEEINEVPETVNEIAGSELFVEIYPFFFGHTKQNIWDFSFGDRIININTSKKNFVNFGEIGTVVGFTDKQLIVLFDNENLSLSNYCDRCRPYRGGAIDAESVINMTKQEKLNAKEKEQSKAKTSNI